MRSYEILNKIVGNLKCNGIDIDCMECPLTRLCNMADYMKKTIDVVKISKTILETMKD